MEHGGAETSINLNAVPERAGRIGWIRALDGADVIPGKMIHFLDAIVKPNITRQSQGPINPVASGITRYISSQFPYRLLSPSGESIKTSGYCFPPRPHASPLFTAFSLCFSYPLYRFFAVFRFSPLCG